MHFGRAVIFFSCLISVSGCGTSGSSLKPPDPIAPLKPSARSLPEPLLVPRPSPGPVNPIDYPYSIPSALDVSPFEAAGYVLSQGKGIGGIRLSLINNADWKTISLVTDSQGCYRANNLPAGNYFIHYYNDSDNGKIGFWKTLSRPVDARGGAYFAPFDVYLVGMKNTPGQGAGVSLPFLFHWTPYPLALSLRFRVHDAGGPGGKALYISERLPADSLSFSYDGTINQPGWGADKLQRGTRCLWGIYYDAGDAGEGGNLYQDFIP